jgi:hypothetical protein
MAKFSRVGMLESEEPVGRARLKGIRPRSPALLIWEITGVYRRTLRHGAPARLILPAYIAAHQVLLGERMSPYPSAIFEASASARSYPFRYRWLTWILDFL